MKIPILFTVLTICIFYACSGSKSRLPFELSEAIFLAQNEDTVDNYQIALVRNNNFYYTHITKDSLPEIREYFQGKYFTSGDTIFLTYHSGSRPAHVTDYLIKEAQGNFFIQHFTNGKKRVLLRIKKSHFR